MRIALALLAAIALAGCAALDPYATYPLAAAAAAHDARARVAICSDGLVSSAQEVRAAAQKECPAHTLASLLATDWHLQYCPLLLPARATFVCSPDK